MSGPGSPHEQAGVLNELIDRVQALSAQLDALDARSQQRSDDLQAAADTALQVLGRIHDDDPEARRRLAGLRSSADYELAFTDPDPLVSVVIATWNRVDTLIERSIPSALAQTHRNVEVVVVGDASPPETAAAIAELADPRVVFHNLSIRGPYEPEPLRAWLAYGTPGINAAIALARGRWIAPLGDDDAFVPDHIERLLSEARQRRLEFVYGLLRQNLPDGSVKLLGEFPPRVGQIGLQAALYHAGLRFMELELGHALFGKPNDWGLIDRMMRTGVRMAMLDEVSVDYWPSQDPLRAAAAPAQAAEQTGPRQSEQQQARNVGSRAIAVTHDIPGGRLRELPAFSPEPWQMSYGERAVLEGMLQMTKPRLAIEIGRAEGGSLRRIAAHSEHVISFDLVEPWPGVAALANVRPLSGDSHAMLPVELERLATAGDVVDFVLVDGDHSAEGVRRDMEDLLASPAIAQTVILIHDTLNQEVREGLEAVQYEAHEKVAWVDLDFVPGYVARIPERLGECWGGIGLVVADESGAFRSGGAVRNTTLFEQPALVWPVAEWLQSQGESAAARLAEVKLVAEGQVEPEAEQLLALSAELERHREWLDGIKGSASWRLTAPLRGAKRRLRGR